MAGHQRSAACFLYFMKADWLEVVTSTSSLVDQLEIDSSTSSSFDQQEGHDEAFKEMH